MKQFKLIGRDLVFNVTKEYLTLGFIHTVEGATPNGKFKTVARALDVEFIQPTGAFTDKPIYARGINL